MDFIHELITSPAFWIKLAIVILVIALATDLVRRLLAQNPKKFGPRASKPPKVSAAQQTSATAPAPKASAGNKGGWLFKSVIVLLLVLAAAYLWHHQDWFLPNSTPTRSSAAGMYAEPDYPSSLKVPKGGKVDMPGAGGDDWSDAVGIPLRLKICQDAEHGTGSYEMQCHDRHDSSDEWRSYSEDACKESDQVRYKSVGEKQSLSYFFVPSHESC